MAPCRQRRRASPRPPRRCRPRAEELESRVLPSAAARAFVAAAYPDLLGRAPEPAALAGWADLLDRGLSPAAAALAIQASPEYRTGLVRAAYQSSLGRPADPLGIAGGLQVLNLGGTPEQLRAVLFGSPEYFVRRGGGSGLGFLAALYRDALGRPLDPAGLATFGPLLGVPVGPTPGLAPEQGPSRAQVALAVLDSPEARRDQAAGYYQRFLGRGPDPVGFPFSVSALLAGARDEIVVAGFVGSAEYQARAARRQLPQGPRVVIQSPTPGLVTSGNVTVAGRVADDLSGVAALQAQVDSGDFFPIPFDAAGSFQFQTALPLDGSADGAHTVTLVAADRANNQTTAAVTFTLFTGPAAPVVALSPADAEGGDPSRTTARRATLVGRAAPQSTLTLLPTDATALADDTGAFQFPGVPLDVGTNTFTVRVVDPHGRANSATVSIQRDAASATGNVVLDWNQTALQAIQQDSSAPPVASRGLAMVQAAVYDAVNAVQGTPGYYVRQAAPAGASPVAAVAAAAQRVLSYLYPAQQAALDAALAASLAQVPDGPGKDDGAAVGRSVADALIALRAHDGFDAYATYDGGTGPGQWQPTAPMYMAALLPQWARLQPFAMTSPSQFRPAGPPALTRQAWADAFNEVKALGSATSAARTADQTQVARFWADGSGTVTPPGHWNQIAGQVARDQGLSLAEDARLFAELDVAMADAAVVAWDAKYTYGSWRPITAIPAAATAGNPDVQADPNWTPLLVTPNFPEYVSGHSTFSAAAAAVLSASFGDHFGFTTGSPGLAGVTRSFSSFEQAAQEAGQSRIYGGIHFQFSNQDGQAAGQALGQYVVGTFAVAQDTTPPRVALDPVPPGGASNANVTVTGRVTDNLSGVRLLEVQVDQGGYAPLAFDPATGRFAFPTAFALDGSADGPHTITFRATDGAGNASSPVAFPFNLETRAPALTLTSPAAGGALAAGAMLAGQAATGGPALVALSYAFDQGGSTPVPFTPDDGVFVFNQALDLSRLAAGAHKLTVTARDAAGNTATKTLDLTLPAAIPLAVSSLTPADGAVDVGVTFRPKVVFSRPIDPATLTGDNFFATDPSGAKLPAAIVPADDGTSAWLFFTGPLPGASAIRLTVDGSTIKAADGSLLDADGMGMPGSKLTATFTTVNQTAVPGTSLSGVVADPGPDLKPGTFDDVRPGPDGVLNTADDIYLRPLAGVKVWILGQESQAVFTDAQGRFHFDAVPVGDVKLGIDGRTATNAPAGVYFPEMVMDLTTRLGVDNTVMGSMGSPQQQAALAGVPGVYLPRLQTSLLHTMDASTGMHLGVDAASAPDLTPEQRQMLSIDVPAGSLVGPDGKKLASAQIGISTVPPEMVRDMLPPGLLEHTFDITVQAPGVATFSTPVPLTFPNLFGAAPGSQLNFLSFDHTTGRLVIEGTATVSADGKSVKTDPGTGVTHPGWDGMAPQGGPTCPTPPPGKPTQDVDPKVEIGETGSFGPLQDHLFFRDSKPGLLGGTEGFTIEAQNRAPGPLNWLCNKPLTQTPARVTLTIQGPHEKFLQLDASGPGLLSAPGLLIYVFYVEPGQSKDIRVNLKPLLTPQMIHDATQNVLYGAKITLKVDKLGTDNNYTPLQPDQTSYVYRLFDVADDKHDDGEISFERTFHRLANVKALKLDMPGDVRPHLEVEDPANPKSFTALDDGKITFQPQAEPAPGQQDEIHSALRLTPPGKPPLDPPIKLSGISSGVQEVVADGQSFLTAMAQLENLNDAQLNPLLDNWLGQPNANGHRPKFDAIDPDTGRPIIDTLLDKLLLNRAAIAFDSLAPNTVQFFPTLGLPGILLTFGLASDAKDPAHGLPGAAAQVDFNRTAFSALVQQEMQTSLPEQKFRFAQMLNQSYSDQGPTFSGVRVNLDAVLRSLLNRVPPTIGITASIVAINADIGFTIGHEVGHTLGAIHNFGPTIGAHDLMNEVPTEITTDGGVRFLHFFDKTLGDVTRMALGVPVSDSDFRDFVYPYYKKYVSADVVDASNIFNNRLVGSEADTTRANTAILGLFDGPLPVDGSLPNEVQRLDFGPTVGGGTGSPRPLFLFNNGGQDLHISKVELVNGTSGFTVEGLPSQPFTIPGLDLANLQPDPSTRMFTVRFNPTRTGPASDTLRITSDALGAPTLDIPLSGLGVSPFGDLAVDVPNNNAGGQKLHDPPETITPFATLRNAGSKPLTITSIVPDSASIGQFTPSGLPAGFGPGSPLVLQPGDSFPLGLAFSPKLIGLQRGRLQITSDDPNKPVFNLPVVGTGLADTGSALVYAHDFVALDEAFNPAAPVLRQVSDGQGNWSFFLPPNTPIHYTLFDPVSGLIAHGLDTTDASGMTTVLSPVVFQASTAPDTSGDGLPDDVKFAVGIASTSTDPGDFVKVQEGLDPAHGGPLPTGVVASLDLTSNAHKIVVMGNTAYVATNAGLAAVDVTRFTKPRLVALVDLPNALDLAIDPKLAMGAVATGNALTLLDFTDPTRPAVRQTLTLPATHVVAVDGIAYAVAGTELHAIDLVTGEEVQKLALSLAQAITDLTSEGTRLYALAGGNLLVLDVARQGSAQVVGRLQDGSLASFTRMAVNQGVAYLGDSVSAGFATVDVSDPTRPMPFTGPHVNFSSTGGLAVDGGGLAVVGTLNASNSGVSVFDVTDPRNTGAFLFQIVTPNAAPSDLAVSAGLAFVAQGSVVNVINFARSQVNAQPPTVSITTSAKDIDPDTPGLQVAEGTPIPIELDVRSDSPLRNALLLLNGRVVQSAVTAPFAFAPAPDLATDGPTVTLQVRVTNENGLSALSNPITVGLLPVKVPPAIVDTDPAEGGRIPPGRQGVRVEFSEAMAAATVTPQNFQLHDAAGHTLPVRNLQLRGERRLVQLAYDPLPPGNYLLVIKGAAVTNLAGTPLAAGDVVLRFTVAAGTNPGPLFPDPIFRLPRGQAGTQPVVVTADLTGNGRADLVSARDDLGNLSVQLSNGDGSFAPPIDVPLNLPSGSALLGLAAADLNGDGRADVVGVWRLGNSQTPTAIVLLSKGDGTFASRTDYPLNGINVPGVGAAIPLNFALGDVTGDGRPDIVVEQDVADAGFKTHAHFVVLPGKADGTFGTPIESNVDGGLGNTLYFAPADVNGDGRADLVAISSLNLNVNLTVLLSNGDGTFGRRQDSPLPHGIVLGPSLVNSPGHVQLVADLAPAGGTATVSLLPINGDGTLGIRRDVFVVPPGEDLPNALAADLAGDGRTDLVLSRFIGANGHLTVLMPKPDGTFAPADDFDLEFGPVSPMLLADVTGHGHPDVVLLYGGLLGYVLANDGHGHFPHQTNYQVGPHLSSPGGPFFGDNFASPLALGDLNGDGKLDLVAATHDTAGGSRLTVQLGNGDGTFRPGNDIPLEHSGQVVQSSAFVLGDVYGNGKLDVVTATHFLPGRVGLSIYPGNGDGTFGARKDAVVDIPSVANIVPLAAGDVNGDGHPDLIALTVGDSFPTQYGILVLYGQADGTFAFNAKAPLWTLVNNFNPLQISTFNAFGSLTLADVNGDGIPDLVFLDALADGSAAASVVLGDKRLGPGLDFRPQRLDFPLPSLTSNLQTRVLQVADVNGDGLPDLVIAEDLPQDSSSFSSAGFRISVFPGTGHGTFAAISIDSTFPISPSHVRALALGDLFGAGKVDAVVANQGDAGTVNPPSSLTVLRSKGEGAFGSPTEFEVGPAPIAVRLGDLDNNGDLDVVTMNAGGNFPTVSPRLNRTLLTGMPLRAQIMVPTPAGAVPAGGPDDAQLAAAAVRLTQAAVASWSAALGVPLALQPRVLIGELPAGQLAAALPAGRDGRGVPAGGTMVVDPRAGGLGWFVDGKPGDDAAFATRIGATAFRATDGSAAGRYDLFTALLHEVGHLLGIPEGEDLAGRAALVGDLMSESLAPSVRELPSALDVEALDRVFASAELLARALPY